MLDEGGVVLYVGKAKNLKKRVSSYFQRQLDTKSLQLVKRIHNIEVTITRNEREALLLESNLIKELKPRYNIIFRDDKSYPYLLLSAQSTFPRLSFYRGDKTEPGFYYGPYPSSLAAREALTLLQNIFKLRQCDDLFFKQRTRPCLQYQIKRCTAPCVGYISPENYKQDVLHTQYFLEGKSNQILHILIERMMAASAAHQYEQAATLRDQIARLRGIQEQQIIMNTKGNVDVLGLASGVLGVCVHVLVIREGNILGSRSYFPDNLGIDIELDEANTMNRAQEVWLNAFIMQHYLGVVRKEDIPDKLIVSLDLREKANWVVLLSEKKGAPVQIAEATRGDPLKWLGMANESAKQAYRLILKHRDTKTDFSHRMVALQEALQLPSIPERLECFDVSHSLGEATVASCVVLTISGPSKSDYRRFNIKAKTQGDDYAALAEALTRHYTRLKSEGRVLPDILIMDGGKGQVGVAVSVLKELQVTGVVILGISKGVGRKPGLDTVHLYANGHIRSLPGSLPGLDPASPAFHLIQYARDEAHRFAIRAHRQQRAKKRLHSILEDIPGVGRQRHLSLLRHFGGLQEVRKAGVEELAKVPGVSRVLAERIYSGLHGV